MDIKKGAILIQIGDDYALIYYSNIHGDIRIHYPEKDRMKIMGES
tara:strand:+ start:598 stop:732 length:135 start_codon:yes stop_codon:yes gene_type:complete